MSDEPLPYSPRFIQLWSALSILIGLILFGMFIFGPVLMHAGASVWHLLRWLASPII
jgi:hypothetical protein